MVGILVENGERRFVGHVDVELFVDAFLGLGLDLEEFGVVREFALLVFPDELFAVVPGFEFTNLFW